MFKHSRYATIKPSEKEWIKILTERINNDGVIYDINKLKAVLQIIINRYKSREFQRRRDGSIEKQKRIKAWKELKPKLRAINF